MAARYSVKSKTRLYIYSTCNDLWNEFLVWLRDEKIPYSTSPFGYDFEIEDIERVEKWLIGHGFEETIE